MMEIWKPIKESDGKYEISNLGRVKSNLSGKILKQSINRGYKYVYLRFNNKCNTRKVHRLVAEHFIEKEREDQIYVDHIDTNRGNNVYTNLRWCTFEENCNNPLTKINISNAQKSAYQKIKERNGGTHPMVVASKSDESREKLSNSLKLAYLDKERRKAISNRMKELWGNKEWRQNQVNKRLGKKLSEETKKKLSILNSGENSHFFGKHHTDESRRKMRENHFDVKNGKNPSARAVKNIETGQVFETATLGGKSVNKTMSGILQAIKRNGRCGGFHWEYADEKKHKRI